MQISKALDPLKIEGHAASFSVLKIRHSIIVTR